MKRSWVGLICLQLFLGLVFCLTMPASAEARHGSVASTTKMTISPNPATLGQTVRTSSGAAGAPKGTVKFMYAGNVIGTVTVNDSGVATLTAPSNGIPAGKYAITAVYSGDGADLASTSPAVTVTVE